MKRKLMYAFMAMTAMLAMNSCEPEDIDAAYDDKTSLNSPFIFSEGYQDTIVHEYNLTTPISDWLSMI